MTCEMGHSAEQDAHQKYVRDAVSVCLLFAQANSELLQSNMTGHSRLEVCTLLSCFVSSRAKRLMPTLNTHHTGCQLQIKGSCACCCKHNIEQFDKIGYIKHRVPRKTATMARTSER